MAVELYATDSARRYTAAALDAGDRPSVASAILKVHLTEAGRRAINDGMDILGGKAIMHGPSNLLSIAYRHTPIAITVEGANLLTRSLIIFGQGAIRCHPHVLNEMQAVAEGNADALGEALLGHVRHVLRNVGRAVFSANVVGSVPPELRAEAKLIATVSAKYALTADIAMGLLGGELKRMELLSSRLGDVLAHLYMASASLWRFHHEPDPAMLPFARAAIQTQLHLAATALRELYANLPSASHRLLGAIVLRGTTQITPSLDKAQLALAEALRTQPDLMDRLAPDIGRPRSGGMADLMDALELALELDDETTELNKVLRETNSIEEAARRSRRPQRALAYLRAADKVIQVDDFPMQAAPKPVSPHVAALLSKVPRQQDADHPISIW